MSGIYEFKANFFYLVSSWPWELNSKILSQNKAIREKTKTLEYPHVKAETVSILPRSQDIKHRNDHREL